MERQGSVATAAYHAHQHPHHLHHAQHYHDQPSLAYRPLQLSLQHLAPPQQHHHHHHHLLQQQQQHPAPASVDPQPQLSLVASGAGYPNFRHHHPPTLPHRTRHQIRQEQQQQQRRTMAYEAGHQISDDELAQLQKASEGYEPPVSGPLIGHRQPSTAITSEYASADPVYQAKTQSLPQKYSHYRTVRGDGKCGWRAVAFGYYEALIHHGDLNRFGMEEARLKSIAPLMTQAGFNPTVIDDFADEAFDLLRELANAMAEGLDAGGLLVDKFNDDVVQNYIITYMRSLTAAWMKSKETEYAPWLLGQTVESYCQNQVLPVKAEIDNVALSALKDVLLSPAGILLEVLYLDRSEGSEVTMHRFDPVASGGFILGSVRLLYRPGHYDILYKQEDLPVPPPSPAAVPTYLQYGSQTYYEPAATFNGSDFMALLPGMSYANQTPFCGMPSSFDSYDSASDFNFTTNSKAPVTTCTPAVPTPSAPAPQPHMQSQSMFASASPPVQMVPPASQLAHDMVVRNVPQFNHSDFGGGPFRPSAWQFDSEFVSQSQMPFQTSIFRNSPFNQAHFQNPDFQPEQWDPEGEYATASSSSSSKSSRHKNSG
ncbi:Ubiquitin thioesterase otubain-like [Cercospora beticola]|uniref:ubiquitinyl hydrolase 1 n=2 Tax=Cercospora beticola TaxID=122368 RepID=A0A2G5I040_CERBT|nr:Ubiquitin thioesterase otubain-like [Cercospora beticola]PIA98140.1 Ubiquitin thioesterase otubain-like [Cercospora beticola]